MFFICFLWMLFMFVFLNKRMVFKKLQNLQKAT